VYIIRDKRRLDAKNRSADPQNFTQTNLIWIDEALKRQANGLGTVITIVRGLEPPLRNPSTATSLNGLSFQTMISPSVAALGTVLAPRMSR
jgi:hypothetical protein